MVFIMKQNKTGNDTENKKIGVFHYLTYDFEKKSLVQVRSHGEGSYVCEK